MHRLGKRGCDLGGPLDPDAPYPKAPGYGSEIGRSKADQLLPAARPIAGDPADAGQILANAQSRCAPARCAGARSERLVAG